MVVQLQISKQFVVKFLASMQCILKRMKLECFREYKFGHLCLLFFLFCKKVLLIFSFLFCCHYTNKRRNRLAQAHLND